MAEYFIQCSLSRAGIVWDNAAMASFFSTLTTERTAGRGHHSWDAPRADVFDDIESLYTRRYGHSPLGYLSAVAFEERQRSGQLTVRGTGSRPWRARNRRALERSPGSG